MRKPDQHGRRRAGNTLSLLAFWAQPRSEAATPGTGLLAVASRRRQLTYALSVGLLLCAPVVGFYAGLVYFGYTLNEFTPAVPNDQVVYFLSSQAFDKAGFNAGYFTMDEEAARASFSHFDPHGPVFPMLYGTLARCVGLSYASGPIFNVVLLSAALAAWCLLVRPGQALVLWTAVLFLTYWPYYAFVYSWMQETTHLAIAVVLAGLFTAALEPAALLRERFFSNGGGDVCLCGGDVADQLVRSCCRRFASCFCDG